jgi:cytochrome P450
VFGSLSAIKEIGMSSRYIPNLTFNDDVLELFRCKGLGRQFSFFAVEFRLPRDLIKPGLLLNKDVERWKVQRKVFVQSLAPHFIEHVGRLTQQEGRRLVEAIRAGRNREGACNIHSPVQNLFARTIVPLALGFDEATTEGIVMTAR